MEYANNTAAQQTIAAYAATKTENALPDNYVDEKSINCNVNTASPIDLLYSPNIRGGRKMVGSCGCNGMTGGKGGSGEESNQEIIGGCLSCKKGGKRIVFIYKTIHIIIPRLYKKYKSISVSSPEKIMEIAKVPKVPKVPKETKVPRVTKVMRVPKAAKAARLANALRVKNAAKVKNAARAARAVKKL